MTRKGAKTIDIQCPRCGKKRNVIYHEWVSKGKKFDPKRLCRTCNNRLTAGNKSDSINLKPANWKGGRYKCQHLKGYIKLQLSPNSKFYNMTDARGYIYEHRLIMAEHFGRCLNPSEIVHHKDGDGGNNDIENLELISRHEHDVANQIFMEFDRLRNRNTKLENQIGLLKAVVKLQNVLFSRRKL